MAKFSIEWMEIGQTSTGKTKATATLKNEQGAMVEGVTLWKEGWTNFDALKPGSSVEGDYVEKQNGQYLNKTLYQAKTYNTFKKPAGNMNAMMEKKKDSIEKFQGNKEQSIKVASTMSKAVDLAIAQLGSIYGSDDMEKAIRKWRLWLWNEWDADDSKFPPFH